MNGDTLASKSKTVLLITGSPGHRRAASQRDIEASVLELLRRKKDLEIRWSSHEVIPQISGITWVRASSDFISQHDAVCSAAIQQSQVESGLSGVPKDSLVIRIRSDFLIYDPEVFLNTLHSHTSVLGNDKILLLYYGTQNLTKTPEPFKFSDFFQAGTAVNLLRYFQKPHGCCGTSMKELNFREPTSPEVIWATNFFYGDSLRAGNKWSRRFFLDAAIAQSQHFLFEDHNNMGLRVPAIASKYSKTLHLKCSLAPSQVRRNAMFAWLYFVFFRLRFAHPVFWVPKLKIAFGLNPKDISFSGFD